MANDLSIRVSVDSKAAVADFKRLTDQIHATEMAARKAGSGFQAMGTAAENTFGRIAARAAQARREVEQLSRAQSGPQFGAATGGGYTRSSFSLSPGAQTAIIGSVGAAVVGAAYTGYGEAREQAQAESYLANAARQTGQAYAQQATEVARLRRELGLTRAEATQLQAAALRFTGTIGRPQDAGRLAGALGNALAASGRSSSEIPERLRQLQTGQDELFDVLGPVKIGKTTAGSPEAIYNAYAREILHVNRELSDLEKTQARYYAVLQAGEASVGAAAERMASSAGQIDRLTNSFKDLTGNIVTAIMATKEFKGIASAAGGLAEGGANSSAAQAAAFFARVGGRVTGITTIAEGLNLVNPQSDPLNFGAIGRGLLGQGRNIAEMFGLGSGPSFLSGLSSSYRGALDKTTYLGRDPFGGVSAGEQHQNQQNLAKLRNSAYGYAGSIASSYSGVVSAGDILAGLNGGESPSARAARIFTASGGIASDAAAAYRIAGFGAGDAQSMAEAEARRFRISTIGSVAPGELSADQEAAYREDLKRFQEDTLKQQRETLLEAVKTRKALEKIAGKLAPDDPIEAEPVTINIENRSDTVARFELIASGNSLTGGGPAGDR